LQEIFNNDRPAFEKKWDDLKLFIEYGMISDEKFYERAEKFALFKNTDNKYFTFEEYEKLIKENQTDKHKNLVYLYASDKDAQYSFIDAARSKGYDVLLMDGQLDPHFINQAEQKFKDSRFVRVDSDVVDKLIVKDEIRESKLTAEQKEDLTPVFQGQLPENPHFMVVFENLDENDSPVLITQSEFMRRMKDMSSMGGGMGFYGKLPDSYSLVVNSNHSLIQTINEKKDKKLGKELTSIAGALQPLEEEKSGLEKAKSGMKVEEIPQADKDKLTELEKQISEQKEKRTVLLHNWGKENKIVKQLIDLALLSNNMLKGEELTRFLKRSVELIK
jgi:molecular chaperone HtpG